MGKRHLLIGLVLGVVLHGGAVFADSAPPCLDTDGSQLDVNNDQMLSWKKSTKNSWQARGHAQGPIVRLFNDKNGHNHFEIQIGNRASDTLEVIYNTEFGALPDQLDLGSDVEACGDYITSYAASGPYPASPSGAIIHWIHMSPNLNKHQSGYLMIDGVVYGGDIAGAGPKKNKKPKKPHPDAVELDFALAQ